MIKKRVKILIVLCLSLSMFAGLCSQAQAAEMYPSAPLKWSSYTNASPFTRSMTIRWYNYNVINSNWTNQFSSAFSSYWGTRYGVSISRVTSGNDTTALITFVAPAQSVWSSKLKAKGYDPGSVAAITYPFDTNGREISDATSANASTQLIRSARIEVNPVTDAPILSGLTATGYRAILAHEIGHALGFGHYWSSPTIMYSAVDNIKTITSLTSYDIIEFTRKYYGSP